MLTEAGHAALRQADDAHAAAQLGGVGIAFVSQQGVEAFTEWGDTCAEQATSIQTRQQMLHGQQGVDFGGREPQPRQLVRCVVCGVGIFEAVTAEFAAIADGVVQPGAEVVQVPFEGGARHLKR